jgi:hypothetical protein
MNLSLSERLDRMVIDASSPDGVISAELYDRDQVKLRFAPGRFAWLDERDLEHKLEALGRVVWSRRQREYYAILSDINETRIDGEPAPVNDGQWEFVQRREQIVASGQSADGRISLSVKGMQHWTVRVQDGTVRELSEDAFAQGVRDAVKQLLDDQARQITELKVELGERMEG